MLAALNGQIDMIKHERIAARIMKTHVLESYIAMQRRHCFASLLGDRQLHEPLIIKQIRQIFVHTIDRRDQAANAAERATCCLLHE